MRNIRNTYKKPKVPWNSAQIKEDRILMRTYGLRRKKELWKAEEILRKYRARARKLIAANDKRREDILVEKMKKLGLLEKTSGLDDILALSITNILDRRLQSVIVKKGLIDKPKLARQCIVHGHICIDDRKIKFPSYFVEAEEETKIKLHPSSQNLFKKDEPQKNKPVKKPEETHKEEKTEELKGDVENDRKEN
ncbi:MAG: 30S ribosomal protein S4 [Candidatus Aenigmatarchaeota archaeon]